MGPQEINQEIGRLHEEHAGGLLRYARSLAQNDEAARDAVQETFLRYFVERRYGRVIENPKAWLYRVAHNNVLDRLRSASAAPSEPALLESVPARDATPEERIQGSQTAERIKEVLTTRELVCLKLRAEGNSYRDIANLLEIEPGTVGALLARVRRKLECLEGRPLKKGIPELKNAIGYLVREALFYSSA